MTRYKLILEYDGTNTVGLQVQNTGTSIQGLVQDAVYKFCAERTELAACGRTDAGVHAFAMPAHVDIEKNTDSDTIMRAVNFHLNDAPVSVLSCEKVSDDFHARFDCIGRTYRYVILNRGAKPVLDKNRVWWVPQKLDLNKMQNAAKLFLGNHDWTSFRSTECQSKSPIKTLGSIAITKQDDLIFIDVSARSFLHHMVRNIVGTLVEIGLGKDYDIPAIFDARNRAMAGPTAPATGLYFVSGIYPS